MITFNLSLDVRIVCIDIAIQLPDKGLVSFRLGASVIVVRDVPSSKYIRNFGVIQIGQLPYWNVSL